MLLSLSTHITRTRVAAAGRAGAGTSGACAACLPAAFRVWRCARPVRVLDFRFLTLRRGGQELLNVFGLGGFKLLFGVELGEGIDGRALNQLRPQLQEQLVRAVHLGAFDLAVDDDDEADGVGLFSGDLAQVLDVAIDLGQQFLVLQR